MKISIEILLECIAFLFIRIKEVESQSVHQETETTDGGGWFASGDYYLYTSKSEWVCFIGLPIWRLNYNVVKEFYCYEFPEDNVITRKVIFEKNGF